MSWYTDPQLFIGYTNSNLGYYVFKIEKKYNIPIVSGDLYGLRNLDFSRHLNLGNNKESDYDTLKSILFKNSYEVDPENAMMVNCQGLVVYRHSSKSTGTWAREEEIDSIINSLPSPEKLSKKLALEEKIAELVAENSILKVKLENEVDQKGLAEKKVLEFAAEISVLKEKLKNEVTNLQEELNQKMTLQTQVLELTAKLQEYSQGGGSGSVDVQPWMTSDTVPSHWVPFEDLDTLNLNLSKNTPVNTIMEEPSKPKILEDGTTNVEVNRFYRGTFIVAVNVSELSPGNQKARFDPEFWGLYTNEGVTYAARKPLDSEM